MKKDYLEALMEALIVGAVVLLILTGSLLAMEMDKRIESSGQRSYVFSTYLKDDAIRIHSQEGAATPCLTIWLPMEIGPTWPRSRSLSRGYSRR
jgi:hypothetical protein